MKANTNMNMNTNLEAVGDEVGQDGEHEQRTRPREEHHVRVQLARLRARLSHQLQLPRVRRRAERVHFLRRPLRQLPEEHTHCSATTNEEHYGTDKPIGK